MMNDLLNLSKEIKYSYRIFLDTRKKLENSHNKQKINS